MGKEHRLVDMQEICSDNMNTAYEKKKQHCLELVNARTQGKGTNSYVVNNKSSQRQ